MISFVEKVQKVQRVRKVLTFLKWDDHVSAYRHIREPSEPLVPSEPYDSGLVEMKKILIFSTRTLVYRDKTLKLHYSNHTPRTL